MAGVGGLGPTAGLNSAAVDQIANNGVILNQQLGNLINTLQNLLPFTGATGTFTCSAASSTTVANTSVAANSMIFITPTNAAAGTLMAGATSLYLSARTAGTSFAFSTANAGAAAGTETFLYLIINPSG